ncbi:MAG: hypothetical protein ACERLM_05310 [Acidimicrobiales bacterium]
MRVGFAALARPTFDVALAETVSAAAWGRLDDLGHDLLGTPGLILEEGDLAGAVADLAREPLEALVVMQATSADAALAAAIADASPPPPAAVGRTRGPQRWAASAQRVLRHQSGRLSAVRPP